MDAKISVFVICVKAIIYLLLYNLHDCTFSGIMNAESSTTLYENYFLSKCFWYLHKCFRLYEWDTEVSHSSFSPSHLWSGKTGFLNSTKSGGNWNFSISMGEEKEGERGTFEIFIMGKIAEDEISNGKQNFRMNLKMFSWVIW